MGIMDKAKDALNSDKGRDAANQGLDKAEDAANQKFGEEHADKVSGARDKAEEQLGLNNDEANNEE